MISRIADPPAGRSTRRSSARPRSRSSRLRTPKPTVAASKRGVLERERKRVALHPVDLARLLPRPLEHPLREVQAGHSARQYARASARSPGPAARVEHAVARPDHGRRRRGPPALVEPERHRRGSSRRRPARCGRTSPAPPSGASLPASTLTRLTPAAHELVLEPELVEAAPDDEVDEVAHRLGAVVEARREEEDRRPGLPHAQHVLEVDQSRAASRAGRARACGSSFSATLAARWIRFDIAPEAIVPSVPIEHGQIT